MTRRILFVLFADDECRQFHALRYTLDLAAHGHAVRLLLEGAAAQLLTAMDDPASARGALLRQVHGAGLLAGACRGASLGCGCDGTDSPAVRAAGAHGVPLVAGMEGHASLAPFAAEGYEIVPI